MCSVRFCNRVRGATNLVVKQRDNGGAILETNEATEFVSVVIFEDGVVGTTTDDENTVVADAMMKLLDAARGAVAVAVTVELDIDVAEPDGNTGFELGIELGYISRVAALEDKVEFG